VNGIFDISQRRACRLLSKHRSVQRVGSGPSIILGHEAIKVFSRARIAEKCQQQNNLSDISEFIGNY